MRVEGGRELRRRLRTIEGGLDDLKAAHREVAQTVTAASRRTAPHRTGRLGQSGRGSGTNTMSVVRYGSARIPYAGPIHYGWPARGIVAQPWLLETARRTEPVWLEQYNSAVAELVERTRS